MKILRNPWRIKGYGWSINIGVFYGHRWYKPSSWAAYSNPLFRKLKWSNGFSIGPVLFWKEG